MEGYLLGLELEVGSVGGLGETQEEEQASSQEAVQVQEVAQKAAPEAA